MRLKARNKRALPVLRAWDEEGFYRTSRIGKKLRGLCAQFEPELLVSAIRDVARTPEGDHGRLDQVMATLEVWVPEEFES